MFFHGFRTATSKSRHHLLRRIESFATIGNRPANLSLDESRLLGHLSAGRFRDARHLLDEIPETGRHGRVGHHTSLLSKLCRWGYVREAEALFRVMPCRNVVSYNVMLGGFVKDGRFGDARALFDEMGERRNVVSWTTMVSGYLNEGMMDEAWRVFGVMPERNVVSWNVMVVGLIRNGELEEARRVFDEMRAKNVVSWNAMISGYVEERRMEEARELFEEMDERNEVTWTTMVAGYCKRGDAEEGYNFFREMPEKSVVSWTAMIGGFVRNGMYDSALRLFLEMTRAADVRPNEETFISILYACAGVGLFPLGKKLHAVLVVSGMGRVSTPRKLKKAS